MNLLDPHFSCRGNTAKCRKSGLYVLIYSMYFYYALVQLGHLNIFFINMIKSFSSFIKQHAHFVLLCKMFNCNFFILDLEQWYSNFLVSLGYVYEDLCRACS